MVPLENGLLSIFSIWGRGERGDEKLFWYLGELSNIDETNIVCYNNWEFHRG